MKPIREFFSGLKSLFIGMGITLRQFFKPTITLQYPHESLKMPKRFRGHIELVRDQETGRPLCYACTLCQKACPSDCIMLEGAKMEGEKKKSVTKYVLDFTKCSLCGACVEVCPTRSLTFGDVNDPASAVSRLLRSRRFTVLQPGAGTRPHVFFLG